MANESRNLNKRFTVMDGFQQSVGGPQVGFEGGTLVVAAPLNVEGALAASAVTFNAGVIGSLAVTNLRVGSSVGNDLMTAMWRTTYTWNIPAIPGIVGSINAVVAADVAMSGAAVGDVILVSPIGSFAADVFLNGACYSAANVNLRARYTGSTGAYTPGNVPIKIVAIKI